MSLVRLSVILLLIINTLPGPSASEVTTLWRYRPTNMFIIIIIMFATLTTNVRRELTL